MAAKHPPLVPMSTEAPHNIQIWRHSHLSNLGPSSRLPAVRARELRQRRWTFEREQQKLEPYGVVRVNGDRLDRRETPCGEAADVLHPSRGTYVVIAAHVPGAGRVRSMR